MENPISLGMVVERLSLEHKASLVVLLELSLGESRLLLVRKIITGEREGTLLVGRTCDASE